MLNERKVINKIKESCHITYLQNDIGVPSKKLSMRRRWHRYWMKIFNAPNF